jgi:hypothetical protein
MPGLLKSTAVCPMCGNPLLAIVDETNSKRVRREYYHEKMFSKVRRKRRCVQIFTRLYDATLERERLEVAAISTVSRRRNR